MVSRRTILTIATAIAATSAPTCSAFAPPSSFPRIALSRAATSVLPSGSELSMDLSSETVSSAARDVGNTAMLLSETEAWVQPVSDFLGPTLSILSFFMLCRVVISWYPTTKVNEFPFNVVVWPTEPLLVITRNAVPPAFGVDISPIVWFGVFTFLNEILLGQQGLLTIKLKYGI